MPQSQTAALSQTPRGRGNRQNQTSVNRPDVRKAKRLSLSSQGEVIAMLKGLKNTRTRKITPSKLKTNRLTDKNRKATNSKTDTGTTALERGVKAL